MLLLWHVPHPSLNNPDTILKIHSTRDRMELGFFPKDFSLDELEIPRDKVVLYQTTGEGAFVCRYHLVKNLVNLPLVQVTGENFILHKSLKTLLLSKSLDALLLYKSLDALPLYKSLDILPLYTSHWMLYSCTSQWKLYPCTNHWILYPCIQVIGHSACSRPWFLLDFAALGRNVKQRGIFNYLVRGQSDVSNFFFYTY